MLWNMAVVAAVAFAAALAGTGLAVRLLRARAILDHPNDRSSHAIPVPRGGGLAVTAVVVVHWALIWLFDATTDGFVFTTAMPVLLLLTLVLAGLSWQDDRRGLSAGLRLAVQALCVGVATLTTQSAPGQTFQGLLPVALDLAGTAFLWLWFINLTNFMDGIDGITGTESASIGLGVVVLALAGAPLMMAASGELPDYAAALAASALGFLCWNWQPARIFLGDVGSIPLGFLLGWLVIEAAGAGLWAAAVLLPLYYLVDATITLLRRILRRERITEAHRSHAFQVASRRLGAHAPVVLWIIGLNVLLIGLALLSVARPALSWLAVAVGLLLTLMLFLFFNRDPAAVTP